MEDCASLLQVTQDRDVFISCFATEFITLKNVICESSTSMNRQSRFSDSDLRDIGVRQDKDHKLSVI